MSAPVLVVTPTLGVSPYLAETVASVAAQPVPTLHVLAAPRPRAARLRERFPHARVVTDSGRVGGLYGAINAALVGTAGDWAWFTYINDDDVLLPGFTEAVRRHCTRLDPEPVAYGNVELVDRRHRHVGFVTVEPNPAWIPALLQQGISPLMQQGMLFRRDCVRRLSGFNPEFRLCGDLDFWLRALVAGERFRHHPITVAQFRLRPGQLSGQTSETVREQTRIVQRLLPQRLPAWRRRAARWRYRWRNLPFYLERIWRHGFRTSYQMLEHAP